MGEKTLHANEIAILSGARASWEGARDIGIRRVSDFASATSDSVVFAEDDKMLQAALASDAGMILTNCGEHERDTRLMVVENPRYAFALCAKALKKEGGSFVHPSAAVDPSAKLGDRVRIGAGAVIEENVTVGDDVEIGSGAVVMGGVLIGSRVVLQAGAVVGSAGFGYVRDPKTGGHLIFPQQGLLVIEDDVEIGANTTIDRGALGETRIGRGTKIDNQVHIGHNCRIGRNVLIAAQVGISGSCVVEDGAVLAGQVGLGDHVSIGPGVILGGSAGVFPGKRLEGAGQMFMGVPAEPLKQYLKTIAQVRRLGAPRGSGKEK